MKTNSKSKLSQRQIIDKKLSSWLKVRNESKPPSGWIRAIRDSLGITTRQLADFLGVKHPAILQLEKREAEGTASLDLLNKFAEGMECKLIYAIVPKDSYSSLEDIVNERARLVAKDILQRVDHSMRLEVQASSNEDYHAQLDALASELKNKMDSRLWDKKTKIKEKKNKIK